MGGRGHQLRRERRQVDRVCQRSAAGPAEDAHREALRQRALLRLLRRPADAAGAGQAAELGDPGPRGGSCSARLTLKWLQGVNYVPAIRGTATAVLPRARPAGAPLAPSRSLSRSTE
ncbi:Exonuclease SbcC [Burkholderia gladioli]|nr:Exonuclease SbcC [Burkholderia gladioli]